MHHPDLSPYENLHVYCCHGTPTRGPNIAHPSLWHFQRGPRDNAIGNGGVKQRYLLKTNQTHSTFSGTTDVHEGLSNMCMVWHNLTINPSVLYFIPGLTTQPDIQVTAPLLQTSLALSGPCQHLLPRWGHNKSKQRNASLENSAPARSASLPILFSMDTKAHDMGNTGHLLVCSCEIP